MLAQKVVYDVTECALFSPLGPLSNLAGHECSLALCSVKAALPDVLRRRGDPSNADGVDATAVRAEDIDREAGEGLGEEARARLEAWRTALVESGFEVVGAVVEPRTVTVQQLREMNGEDDRPVWVCIRGRGACRLPTRRFLTSHGAAWGDASQLTLRLSHMRAPQCSTRARAGGSTAQGVRTRGLPGAVWGGPWLSSARRWTIAQTTWTGSVAFSWTDWRIGRPGSRRSTIWWGPLRRVRR